MAAPESLRLSPHFVLSEFGVPSSPAPDRPLVAAVRRLCLEVLEPMRERFGVCTVTSGLRSTVHNRAVGGAPRSRHLPDAYKRTPAADVRFARGTPEQWAAMAISMGVGGVGLYRTHVHVDQRQARARW